MLKNSFFKTIPFLLFLILFNSCDKEYNIVGSDLIGKGNFSLNKEESSVFAYNQEIGPIQSDNLAINALGIYDNPSFGTTTANFVTQLSLAALSPTFDATAKVKSVVLSVPYFYDQKKTVTNTDGSHTYFLDSIYGTEKAKFKLSVYKSGYYMRSLDPANQFLSPQRYYTDQDSDFYGAIVGSRLNNNPNKAQNDEFFFDAAEHSVTTTTTVPTTTYSPPGMQLDLDKAIFEEQILKAPAAALATNDAFQEYFRGLYFKVEQIGSNPGNLAMINFKGGKITITYEETIDAKVVEKTILLNMTGNTVSLLNESNPNINYTNAIKKDSIEDDNLYLKGGRGSLAILNILGAGQLDEMRNNKYLINEANLIFHVNTDAMGESPIPQRIYLYDFKNNIPLTDYYDSSADNSNIKKSRFIYGGILTKGSNSGDYYYKFRITNHIRNLVKYKDSTNVQLGVVVTEDINTSSFNYLKGTNPIPQKAPRASVMNPLGAIVYGGTPTVPANKRLKLEIYYTKPN